MLKTLVMTFKALSDETRLRIFKLLQEEDELCVCQIMQALKISQPTASRNLGILKAAGLLQDRKEGLWVHYSLSREKLKGKQESYRQSLVNLLAGWLENEEIIKADQKRLKTAVKLAGKELDCQ